MKNNTSNTMKNIIKYLKKYIPVIIISLIPAIMSVAASLMIPRYVGYAIDAMIGEGLVNEVSSLLSRGLLDKNTTAAQAIGYKELIAHLEGHCTLEEAVETIKRETRRYAKRQLTWFRRNQTIIWMKP